ncbi:MAG: hypothetical protein RR814_07160, partial [Oscillospiraceae bacterium]
RPWSNLAAKRLFHTRSVGVGLCSARGIILPQGCKSDFALSRLIRANFRNAVLQNGAICHSLQGRKQERGAKLVKANRP